MGMYTDRIPQAMRGHKSWVLWKLEDIGNRTCKRPYQTNGTLAKLNDPDTWYMLDAVEAIWEKTENAFKGIGYVLQQDNLVIAIDLDHAIGHDGHNKPWAQEILDKADTTYCEISQSGTGYHIFGYGKLDKNYKLAVPGDPDGGQIELYRGYTPHSGKSSEGKYIAMTFNLYKGRSDLAGIQDCLKWLISRYEGAKSTGDTITPKTDNTPSVDVPDGDTITINGEAYTAQGIIELIEHHAHDSHLEKWQSLFHRGDTSAYGGDSSRADAAICNILCFWTHGNRMLIDSIYRQSALMRDKWDSTRGNSTYGEMTIDKAIEVWQQQGAKQFNGQLVFPCLNAKGKPIPGMRENLKAMLDYMGIKVRYNELKHRVDFIGLPPNCDNENRAIAYIRNKSLSYGLTSNENLIFSHLDYLASEDKYTPICDYLNECYAAVLDADIKESQIDALWATIHLKDTANNDFCRKLFIKWLVTCCVMAFNRGNDSAQGLLVLKGSQGIGKTRFLQRLMPKAQLTCAPGDKWFYSGDTMTTGDKDSVLRATSYWLVEWGELSETLKRSSYDSIKAFLTKETDTIRKPYAHAATTEPRRTVFIATVNDERFLADKTGNRRYWTLDVESIDNNTPVDVNTMWGEVMKLYRTGTVKPWLTKGEQALLADINRGSEKQSNEEILLLDSLDFNAPKDQWQSVTTKQVCILLDVQNNRCSLMGKALRGLVKRGLIEARNTNRGSLYTIPPMEYNNEKLFAESEDNE